MTVKEDRSSNFELLKIVAILMVIVLHYCNKNIGGLLLNVEEWSPNFFISHLIESSCIIAVNVFVIITGYFSCQKKSIKISKVINLFLICVFYGVAIFAVYYLCTKPNITFDLIIEFSKTMFSRWFVVTYCILYLLIPFINKLISSISKKELETILIINAVVFYLWHTIYTKVTILDAGYGITNFINLYMVGAYIKLYKYDYKNNKLFILLYLICTIVTTAGSLFFTRPWDYATIFNLISSISMFMIFKNIKVRNSRVINSLATYTFATYIIHENIFIRKWIYNDIFKSNLFWNSNYMVINLILTVIGIFIVCVIIEWIRRITLGKILDKQIDKIKFEISCK